MLYNKEQEGLLKKEFQRIVLVDVKRINGVCKNLKMKIFYSQHSKKHID